MAEEHGKVTISAKEWGAYEWLATQTAWSGMGWWSFGRSALVAVLAYFAQYKVGLRTVNDTWKMIYTSLVAAALVCLIEFAFRLLIAPAKLRKQAGNSYKDAMAIAANTHDKQNAIHEKEKADLRGRLDVMQKEKNDQSRLRIASVTPTVANISGSSSWQVQIAVENTSVYIPINNVELLVESVDPPIIVQDITLPRQVEVWSGAYQQATQHTVAEITPKEAVQFMLMSVVSGSLFIAFKGRNIHFDLAKYGQASIRLMAKGNPSLPARAELKIFGNLENGVVKTVRFALS